MASGSYARKRPEQLQVEEGATKPIPPRATRQLQAARESVQEDYDYEPETMPAATPVRAVQGAARPKVKEGQKKSLSPRSQVAAIISVPSSTQVEMFVQRRDNSGSDSKFNKYWLKPWIICLVGVICFLAILISAGIFQRPTSSFISTDGQAYDIQVGGNQAGTWQHPVSPKATIVVQSGPYVVLGKPSLTVNFINEVLSSYHSPAAGKGQALYDLGVQYGIDPAFALAFFMHESSFGTEGEATKSLSLGNLRCIPNFRCEDNFAQFDTWEDGFKAWYELIRNWYVAVRGLTTVDQIIPVYAPPADNNNDDAYIGSLKHELDTWHTGQIIVT
jgi:hypothetical protein